MYDQ
ncbi:hypothetical protein D047_0213A, partial [Vibrio parahaemolyticus VPTS-2010_2]